MSPLSSPNNATVILMGLVVAFLLGSALLAIRGVCAMKNQKWHSGEQCGVNKTRAGEGTNDILENTSSNLDVEKDKELQTEAESKPSILSLVALAAGSHVKFYGRSGSSIEASRKQNWCDTFEESYSQTSSVESLSGPLRYDEEIAIDYAMKQCNSFNITLSHVNDLDMSSSSISVDNSSMDDN
jgi:hypothetical protein